MKRPMLMLKLIGNVCMLPSDIVKELIMWHDDDPELGTLIDIRMERIIKLYDEFIVTRRK